MEYIDEQIRKYHEEILDMKRYMYENQAQLDHAEKALNRVSVFDSVSFGENALKQKEKRRCKYSLPTSGTTKQEI